MPWNISDRHQRLDFVRAATQPHVNFRELCRRFSVSAPTGYKWLARYQSSGSSALADLPRQPRHCPAKYRAPWRKDVIALRLSHPTWGVRKLRIHLKADHPKASRLPSLRTMGRWLSDADFMAPRRPRSRPGPEVEPSALTVSNLPNEVWTVDFKGWFRTADGRRCDPLTIRDLASRFLLCISLVAGQNDQSVRKVMTALFKRCGLPLVIRVDNGSPFAGQGALNFSRLSVWWLRLGIRVEFTRRAKPQDNGAHERMHRDLKAEAASPPAANPRAQQRRLERWREEFNTERPHEAIGYRFPAALYTPSSRPFHVPPPLSYPGHWIARSVRPNGWIKFRGALRFVGRAFARQRVGLQPDDTADAEVGEVWKVHLGELLIGTLHQCDANGSMRQAAFRKPRKWTAKDKEKKPCVNDVVAKQCKPCRGLNV